MQWTPVVKSRPYGGCWTRWTSRECSCKRMRGMPTALFLDLAQRGADVLIALKHRRRKGFRLIRDRFDHGRWIPWLSSTREVKRGRDITWTLRARPAPE